MACQTFEPTCFGVLQSTPLVDIVTYPFSPTATYFPLPYVMAFQLLLPTIMFESPIFTLIISSVAGGVVGFSGFSGSSGFSGLTGSSGCSAGGLIGS